MFVLKQFLFFRDKDTGKETPIRILDSENPEDRKLIERLKLREEF